MTWVIDFPFDAPENYHDENGALKTNRKTCEVTADGIEPMRRMFVFYQSDAAGVRTEVCWIAVVPGMRVRLKESNDTK